MDYHRTMRRAPFIVIALYAAYLTWIIADGRWSVLSSFWTSDDAFFYLTIARNLARSLGSTFDGLAPTNGYQPLWLIALVGVFRVFHVVSADAGIRAASILASVCAVGGTVILAKLIARIGAPPTATVAATLGLLLSYGLWYVGLEAHLNVVTAGLFFSMLWVRWQEVRKPSPWSAWHAVAMAVAAALIVLTRLDLVVWVVVALLAVSAARWIGGWSRVLVVKTAAVEQGISAVMVLGYLAMNRTVFGVWMPISAVLRTKPLGLDLGALTTYRPVDVAYLIVVIAIAAVLLSLAIRQAMWRGVRALAGSRAGYGAVLAAGVIAHTLVALLCSVSMEPRYVVTSSCAVAVIGAILFAEWVESSVPPRRTVIAGSAAVCVVLLAAPLVSIASRRLTPSPIDPLTQFREAVVARVSRGTVMFAVDYAGQLAWFCDCHLINGDGLVNNWNYQRFVTARRVKDYLDINHVEFIVDTDGGVNRDVASVVWIGGHDWKARGNEEFPIVGYDLNEAVLQAGPFRLFRYPDGALAPPPPAASTSGR